MTTNRFRRLWVILFGLLFVILTTWLAYWRAKPDEKHRLITSDGIGYYCYLTSLFIEKDVLHQWWAKPLENGYTLNKYTCGVAILESPFFFTAQLLARISGEPQAETMDMRGRGTYHV